MGKFYNTIGLTGCKWSSLKDPGTEIPVSHSSWEISISSFSSLPLPLWGNKNWLPSMNVKKLENFQNKSG